MTLRNWLCSGPGTNCPPEQVIPFVDPPLVFDTPVNEVLKNKSLPDYPVSPLMAYMRGLPIHVMRCCGKHACYNVAVMTACSRFNALDVVVLQLIVNILYTP